jgi:hypothetical protein
VDSSQNNRLRRIVHAIASLVQSLQPQHRAAEEIQLADLHLLVRAVLLAGVLVAKGEVSDLPG